MNTNTSNIKYLIHINKVSLNTIVYIKFWILGYGNIQNLVQTGLKYRLDETTHSKRIHSFKEPPLK